MAGGLAGLARRRGRQQLAAADAGPGNDEAGSGGSRRMVIARAGKTRAKERTKGNEGNEGRNEEVGEEWEEGKGRREAEAFGGGRRATDFGAWVSGVSQVR